MPEPKQIHGVAPMFLVRDIARSAAYYRDVLGFAYDKIWGGDFCMPCRDGVVVMLSQTERHAGVRPNGDRGEFDGLWDAYVWVRDADRLFEEFTSRGATVVYPPTDKHHYGNREFAIRDPDGYVIAFAHDIASHHQANHSEKEQP